MLWQPTVCSYRLVKRLSQIHILSQLNYSQVAIALCLYLIHVVLRQTEVIYLKELHTQKADTITQKPNIAVWSQIRSQHTQKTKDAGVKIPLIWVSVQYLTTPHPTQLWPVLRQSWQLIAWLIQTSTGKYTIQTQLCKPKQQDNIKSYTLFSRLLGHSAGKRASQR